GRVDDVLVAELAGLPVVRIRDGDTAGRGDDRRDRGRVHRGVGAEVAVATTVREVDHVARGDHRASAGAEAAAVVAGGVVAGADRALQPAAVVGNVELDVVHHATPVDTGVTGHVTDRLRVGEPWRNGTAALVVTKHAFARVVEHVGPEIAGDGSGVGRERGGHASAVVALGSGRGVLVALDAD